MADGVANIWANLTDGLGVRLPNNFQFIFYKENTSSIQTDLAGMPASQQAMAVDTKLHYVEIDFGVLQPVNQMVNLPYVSDRVVFVVDQAAPELFNTVQIDLGFPDISDGLTHPQGGDGETIDISIGGRIARRNVDPNEDFYFYFDVAESCFALSSESIFWVTSLRRTSIHWWT